MNIIGWYIFLIKELVHFLPRAVYLSIFPRKDRDPNMVKRNYDVRYSESLQQFKENKPNLDSFLFGYSPEKEWMLLDDNIVWGTHADTYKAYVENLEKTLQPYLQSPNALVVEFGCGNGRNLLYLKSKYPQVRFVGIELSPQGVAFAKELAQNYNLSIDFFQGDLTTTIPLPQQATVVYSSFSLEQMPRIFPKAISNMSKTTTSDIIFFEPVPELFSWDLRGLVSRLRAIVIDRLRYLLPYLKKNGYTIKVAKRLGFGNPLNEACLVIIKR